MVGGRRLRSLILWAAVVLVASPVVAQEPAIKLDKDRFEFSQVEYDSPARREDQNREEFAAQTDIVLHARQFPTAKLEAAARRTLTLKDLLSPPGRDFQYDLIYFEGRLARLRDVRPTKPLAAAGVTALYEGWLFPTNAADPICVLVTELPPGLEESLEYKPHRPAAVAGYFFKLIQYESGDPKHRYRRAPLLIGRSVTLLPTIPTTDEDWLTGFLPAVLGLIGIITMTVLGLTWFYRRGDRAHRSTMAARREQTNPFSTPNTTEDEL